MAPATKRLNLSATKRPDPTAASSSEGDERSDAAEQTEDESDNECVACVYVVWALRWSAWWKLTMVATLHDREFEIPPGFESVRGSAALTRDAVLSEDKELWFFKLPKHVRITHLITSVTCSFVWANGCWDCWGSHRWTRRH